MVSWEASSVLDSYLALHQHVKEDLVPLWLISTGLEAIVEGACVRCICCGVGGWKETQAFVMISDTVGCDKMYAEPHILSPCAGI